MAEKQQSPAAHTDCLPSVCVDDDASCPVNTWPRVECPNCGADQESLAFGVTGCSTGPEMFQGCDLCSETTWTGDLHDLAAWLKSTAKVNLRVI